MSELGELYKLDNILVKPKELLIQVADEETSIEPKLMAVLVFFIKHPKQVISRQTLIEQIWQGAVISDNAVNRTIAQLRKLLQDDSRQPKYIKTISKLGYQFIAEAEVLSIEHAQKKKKVILTPFFLMAFFIVVLVLIYSFRLKQNEQANGLLDFDNMTQVTSHIGVEFDAATSYDDKILSYIFSENSSESDSFVFRNLLTEQELTHEVEGKIINYSWHPSTEKLLYSKWNNMQQRRCSIHILQLNNKQLIDTEVLECPVRSLTAVDWHYSGTQFFYLLKETVKSPSVISRYDLDKGEIMGTFDELLNSHEKNSFYDHSFIRSNTVNRQLAVLRRDYQGKSRLKIFSQETEALIQSVDLEFVPEAVSWQNQEQAIILSDGQRWYRLASTGGLVAIAELPPYLLLGAPEQVGLEIFFTNYYMNTSIEMLSLQQDKEPELTSSPFIKSSVPEYNPLLSRLNNDLVFFRQENGLRKLIFKAEDLQEETLSLDKNFEFTYLNWTRQNKLLFKSNGSIYELDPYSKVYLKLVDKKMAPEYSAKNSKGTLYFSANMDGQMNIYQKEVNSKDFKQLTFDGGFSMKLSSDERYLYYTKYGEHGLWKLDLVSASTELVLDDFHYNNWQSWSLFDDGVYYSSAKDAEVSLKFYDFSTAQSVCVRAEQELKFKRFTVSQEQDFILYTKELSREGDLYKVSK